jgi:hypothetical protein
MGLSERDVTDMEVNEYYAQADDESDEDVRIEDDMNERRIVWQAKDLSIREFQSMKQDGELQLQPGYQRKYVMDVKLASKLIESVLMDVPIPVIYLAEEQDGTLSVIDGQQRLTSFISFLEGKFPNGKDFALTGLKVMKELNRKKFSDLDKKHQKKIKNTTIHTIIIKRESHEQIKFEIFERLNTGSIKLNEDEIRNTIYRGNYINLLAELEDNETFHSLVQRDNFKKRMIYRGMILRFFALSEKYIHYKNNMKEFCNKELRDNRNMSQEKQKEYEERFKKCVDLVSIVFGDKAFRRFVPGNATNPHGEWVTSRINMALFDVQMCGFTLYSKHQVVAKSDEIREAMIKLMSYNDEFISAIENKTSDRVQLLKRFKIWFETLDTILGQPKNEPRVFSYQVKKRLFEQNPTCALCGQSIQLLDDAEVDHIRPYSLGGKTDLENAQLTHRYCNRAKKASVDLND